MNIEYLLDYEKNNYKMRERMFYESNEWMCHESCGNETHSRCSNNLGLDFIIFMSLGNCTNSLTHWLMDSLTHKYSRLVKWRSQNILFLPCMKENSCLACIQGILTGNLSKDSNHNIQHIWYFPYHLTWQISKPKLAWTCEETAEQAVSWNGCPTALSHIGQT